MSEHRPPVEDIDFVLENIVRYDELAALPDFQHADLESVEDLLAAAGEFVAEAVAPVDRPGDVEGAQWHPDHTVTAPSAYKPVYEEFVKAGWPSVPFPEEFGGGGFPWTVGLAVQEMLTSASMGFSLAPLLTQGAIDALLHYGSDEQKAAYLPRMVSGEWTGTMNLTEPQAGSDVGALATRAVDNGDGSYAITGQKIFISFGEHDLAGAGYGLRQVADGQFLGRAVMFAEKGSHRFSVVTCPERDRATPCRAARRPGWRVAARAGSPAQA